MAERLYRIQMAAQLSGVSEGLIRAWERRYGLLKPRRTPGGYRAYTERDIELLRRIRKLTEEGISIAEAARLAPSIRRQLDSDTGGESPLAPATDGTQLERWKRDILAAGGAFDQGHVDAVLDQAFAALPPLAIYDQLLVPVQIEVGERWHRGEIGVAEEHLVTHAIRARLISLLKGPGGGKRQVVCACFPEEQHEIGLLGTALRFLQAGYRVTYLGARTPLENLLRTAQAVEPDLVAVSVVTDPGKRTLRATLEALRDSLPSRARLVVGGAAARAHAPVLKELGVRLVDTEADWAALLD